MNHNCEYDKKYVVKHVAGMHEYGGNHRPYRYHQHYHD